MNLGFVSEPTTPGSRQGTLGQIGMLIQQSADAAERLLTARSRIAFEQQRISSGEQPQVLGAGVGMGLESILPWLLIGVAVFMLVKGAR